MNHLQIKHFITVTNIETIEYKLPFNDNNLQALSILVNQEEIEGLSLKGGVLTTPPLEIGDKITIIIDPSSYSFLHILKQYGKSLFKEYNSKQTLKYNSSYYIEGTINDFNFSKNIITYYSPFYSTINDIRRTTGELLSNMSDSLIMEEIYSVSVDAKNNYEEKNNTRIQEDNIPLNVKKYTLYKTAVNLTYSAYLTITGKIGNKEKRLGKLNINENIDLPYIEDMLGRLEKKLKPFEDILNGSKVFPKTFLKASKNSPYPLTSRRSF
jgi:hypothetical protein